MKTKLETLGESLPEFFDSGKRRREEARMEEDIPVATHADGSTTDGGSESNSTDDEAVVAPPMCKICPFDINLEHLRAVVEEASNIAVGHHCLNY